jgi:iron-sulfur cluster assembly protein
MEIDYIPVEVDPVAAQKLREAVAKEEGAKGIRLGVLGGGCSGYTYTMEFLKEPPRENDWLSIQWELTVVVDETSAALLNGTVLEYEEKLLGGGFRFNNPNHRTCGCGESFKETE